MAGHAHYTALLDACVLYPMAMTDALEANRPDLKGRLCVRRDQMRLAVPDWKVPAVAWRALSPCLELPDAKDVHVLAAAIAGHADCIVTANLKHFPRERVDPYGIEVIHPDTFIINQWDLNELVVVAAFKRMRARWKKPETTAEDFSLAMERGGLAATAARLRDAAELI